MLGILVLCACAIPFRARLRRPLVATIQIVRGRKTVADRVAQCGTAVRARLCPIFGTMGMPYPSERVTLVGLKAEQRVEVWAAGRDGQWLHIKD